MPSRGAHTCALLGLHTVGPPTPSMRPGKAPVQAGRLSTATVTWVGSTGALPRESFEGIDRREEFLSFVAARATQDGWTCRADARDTHVLSGRAAAAQGAARMAFRPNGSANDLGRRFPISRAPASNVRYSKQCTSRCSRESAKLPSPFFRRLKRVKCGRSRPASPSPSIARGVWWLRESPGRPRERRATRALQPRAAT